MVQETKLFMNGEWQAPTSGRHFETMNPATGEVLSQIGEADVEDVDRAVWAARAAFEGTWGRAPASERERMLRGIADLIERHQAELARMETLDTGKPIRESARIDIPAAARAFYYYAGLATKIEGNVYPVPGNFLVYGQREPLGVIAQIVPWNFPLLLACWKIAPALACGNTVVLKPSELTPLTALRLAELCTEAGVPPGVVNVLPGYGPTAGAALVRHPGVEKVAFTGSVATGQFIMREAAATLKKVSLELGGKSPNIFFPDTNVEAAIEGALFGIFYGQGEVCQAGSRIFVHRQLYDSFLERLVARAQKISPGDPLDEQTQLGPLVSAAHRERVLGYVATAEREGAKLLCGGAIPGKPSLRTGFFVQPTVIEAPDPQITVCQEEIFGPVVTVTPFESEEQVIAWANEVKYGLAGAVWTSDIRRAHRLAHQLKAGTVWINAYHMLAPEVPFGGYKMSGFGRDLGAHAVEEYTQLKSVWVNLSDRPLRWFK